MHPTHGFQMLLGERRTRCRAMFLPFLRRKWFR